MPLTDTQLMAQHFAYNFYYYGHLIGATMLWTYAFWLVAQEHSMNDVKQRLHGNRPQRREQGIYAPKQSALVAATIINESNRTTLYLVMVVASFLTINAAVAAFIKWQLWHLIK